VGALVVGLVVGRGEVWWGETPDEKGRPFLVVSRDGANAVMQRVLVAPVTRRVRGLPSELELGAAEGLPSACAASFASDSAIAAIDVASPSTSTVISSPSRSSTDSRPASGRPFRVRTKRSCSAWARRASSSNHASE